MEQEQESELDLRKYLDWFLRWAWLIGLSAVTVALVAFLSVKLTPPVYEAKASVVMLRSRTEVNLGSALQTLSQDDLAVLKATGGSSVAGVAQGLQTDAINRRLNSLVAIVPNGAVAQQVSESLKGILPDDDRKPGALVSMVRGEVFAPTGSSAPKGGSDTVQIIASYRDPEKAAAIANAWAQAYEVYVNSIYGNSSSAPYAQIDSQVTDSRAKYDQAQELLLKFLSEDDRINQLTRQIAEDQATVEKLRTGRQTAIAAVVDKQVMLKQQLINAYLESDTANRLLGFNKDQNAKRQILSALLDIEVANRLAVINRDQILRTSVFSATVQSEVNSRLKVFEQQRNELLSRLDKAYARKYALEGLLVEARLMRDQLVKGGESSARSNALALFAFKNRVFATASGLPAFDKLQLQATSFDSLAQSRSAADQLADLNGVIGAMETEVTSLEKFIQDQSLAIAQGQGFQFIDQFSSQYLSAGQTISGTRAMTSTVPTAMSLDSLVTQRYADLFAVGDLAKSAEDVATNTALWREIQKLYPNLYTQDAVMSLVGSVGDKTELVSLANQMADDLLNMKGWEGVTSFTIEDKPLSKEIVTRENNIRLLQANVSRLNQTKVDLQQKSDLAWKAYSTLLSKQQEVIIAAATEGTEVRFASPATPPAAPLSKTTTTVGIGFAVGLLLGSLGAFLLEYEGVASDPRYFLEKIRGWGSQGPVSASPNAAPETIGGGALRATWLSRRVLLILLVAALVLLVLAAIALVSLSSRAGAPKTMLEVAPVLSTVPTAQSLTVSNTFRADFLAPPIASAPAVANPAPTQTASPTAQRSPIVAPTPTPITYVVASGDTLAKIAARFGVTVSALATANNIQDPGKIRTGMVLTIPAGSK